MSNRSINHYPPDREQILHIFHQLQDDKPHLRYISRDDLTDVSQYLNISPAEADGVLSFYRLFSWKPRGRYIIRLCDSLSCRISMSLGIYGEIQNLLGIKQDETTRDGLFTLEIVNCLGNCDTAPNMMVNDTLYTHLNSIRVDEILSACKRGEIE